MKRSLISGPIVALLGIALAVLTIAASGFALDDRDIPFHGMAERAQRSSFDKEAADSIRNTLPPYPYAWSEQLQEAAGDDETATEEASTEQSRRRQTPDNVSAYWEFYRLGTDSARRQLGAVSAGNMRIAVQVFEPSAAAVASSAPTGGRPGGSAVLFIHGYLDHTGLSRYPIAELLDRGYIVVAMDMPGHGLSSGPRGEISDFARYGQAVDAVIEAVRSGQIHGVPRETRLSGFAHSTGGSALLEYLYQGGDELDRIVLAAPLVRLFAFPLARIGVQITSDLIEELPRRVSGSSSNDEYIEFAGDHDPLAIHELSMQWSEAYLVWEESRRNFPVHTLPVLLLQPGEDTVVDTDYNTEFLSRVFSRLEYAEFEEARHAILNEPRDLRRGLYEVVDRYLGGRR